MKSKFTLIVILTTLVLLLVSGASPSSFAEEKVFKWKLQTVDDAGLMSYKELALKFANRVKELSNGRLDIKVFPAGGLVPTFEVWDAVRKGMIDMTIHYLVYWSGKVPSLALECEWAVNIDPDQSATWSYMYGGNEFREKILSEYGLHYLGAGILGEEHIWSKVPINGVENLKGLKIRGSALEAEMLKELGATVVFLPGGEVYQALERGVIDACEFTTPIANFGYGLHEVTKYVILPSYGGKINLDWFVGMKAWNELPKDLQQIVMAAMHETLYLYQWKYRLEVAKTWDKLRKVGMQFITWSDEDMKKVQIARNKARQKYVNLTPMTKAIYDSRMEFLKLLGYQE